MFEILENRQLMTGGLAVTRILPLGSTSHPFDTLDVQFNAPVMSGGFPLSAVSMLGPGGASVTPIAISEIAPDHFTIDFTGKTTTAAYQLTISSSVQAADGSKLDQNHNGIPGEATDAYVANLFGAGVTIASGVSTFDGTAILVDGGTAKIDGTHAFANFELVGGAIATVSPPTGAGPSKLDLSVADQLYIDATSKIDVSGLGYGSGQTSPERDPGFRSGRRQLRRTRICREQHRRLRQHHIRRLPRSRRLRHRRARLTQCRRRRRRTGSNHNRIGPDRRCDSCQRQPRCRHWGFGRCGGLRWRRVASGYRDLVRGRTDRG